MGNTLAAGLLASVRPQVDSFLAAAKLQSQLPRLITRLNIITGRLSDSLDQIEEISKEVGKWSGLLVWF